MRKLTTIIMVFASLGVLAQFGAGCGGGTTTGNGQVSLKFDTYNNVAWYEWLLIPSAHAAIGTTELCLARLRFKADSSQSGGNVDFEPGLVTLDAAGTDIGTISLAAGTYKRVEFDVDQDCAVAYSARILSNSNGGPWETNDTITIKFDGTFEADGTDQVLALGIQAIVDALDAVAADGDIKTELEAASGDF